MRITAAILGLCLLALGPAPTRAQRELITNDLYPEAPDLYTADLNGPDPGLITGELTRPGAALAVKDPGLPNPDGCTLERQGECLAVSTEGVVAPLPPISIPPERAAPVRERRKRPIRRFAA